MCVCMCGIIKPKIHGFLYIHTMQNPSVLIFFTNKPSMSGQYVMYQYTIYRLREQKDLVFCEFVQTKKTKEQQGISSF